MIISHDYLNHKRTTVEYTEYELERLAHRDACQYAPNMSHRPKWTFEWGDTDEEDGHKTYLKVICDFDHEIKQVEDEEIK